MSNHVEAIYDKVVVPLLRITSEIDVFVRGWEVDSIQSSLHRKRRILADYETQTVHDPVCDKVVGNTGSEDGANYVTAVTRGRFES
jgi:hypothetical protein